MVEARRQLSIATEAFQTHRRPLFQNHHLSLPRRRELFATLVLSKLCYGLESWVFSFQNLVNYTHGSIIKLYKPLLRIPADKHMDD